MKQKDKTIEEKTAVQRRITMTKLEREKIQRILATRQNQIKITLLELAKKEEKDTQN